MFAKWFHFLNEKRYWILSKYVYNYSDDHVVYSLHFLMRCDKLVFIWWANFISETDILWSWHKIPEILLRAPQPLDPVSEGQKPWDSKRDNFTKCVCVPVCRNSSVYIFLGPGITFRCLPLLLSTFIFWDRVSCYTWSLLLCSGIPCLLLQPWGYRCMLPHLGWFVYWGLEHSPHACTVSH